MNAEAFSVAANTQLDAAPLNSQALGRLINKVNKLDQLNIIKKAPAAGRRLAAGFLVPIHIP